MARPVTLEQLIARIRRRADMADDPSVTDADITDIINCSSWPELYDLRIRGYGNDSDCSAGSPTVTGADMQFPTDFYALRKIFVVDNGRATALKRATDDEMASGFGSKGKPTHYFFTGNACLLLPEPDATYQYAFMYYPSAPVLVDPADTIDDVNGWTEFIVVDAAMQLLQREESDVSVLMAQKEALRQRIQQAAANRDQASPPRVTDVAGGQDADLVLTGFYS